LQEFVGHIDNVIRYIARGLISVIPANDLANFSVFKTDMIHESMGTMIVGPFFDNHVVFDVTGLEIILVIAVILPGLVIIPVNPFFFPDFHMVGFTAFCQNFGFIIAFRN
jgi:hypothetical protein